MTTRTPYEVPLNSQPQTFSIQMAGISYRLTVRWNIVCEAWVLDIADANGNMLVSGIPLITGADLLGQYGYLEMGGSLIVQTDGAPDVVPTYENLGTQGHLYFVVESP